ncbi:MAG: hypothetical protein ACOYXR_09915 [Nitrospirota bacterium]
MEGAGAAANAGGIAAGGNATINNYHYKTTQVRGYMRDKGPLAYKGMGNPVHSWDTALKGEIAVSDLRELLLNDSVQHETLIHQPKRVSVKGLLYPSALLVSGWWESRIK